MAKNAYDDIGMVPIRERAERATAFYVSNGKNTWPKDKVERRPLVAYQKPSQSLRMCVNEFCRMWLSTARDRCFNCATPLAAVLLALVLLSAPAAAQSLPVRILNAPDRGWEHLQRRYPVLYTWDNSREKTWLWHGALTWGVGGLIGGVSRLSARQGRHVGMVFYVVREVAAIVFEGNRKWVDSAGDVGLPLIMARVRF